MPRQKQQHARTINRRPARHGSGLRTQRSGAATRQSTPPRPGQKQLAVAVAVVARFPAGCGELNRLVCLGSWVGLGRRPVLRAARRYRVCKLEWTKRAPRCTYAVSTGASASHSTPARPSHVQASATTGGCTAARLQLMQASFGLFHLKGKK